MQSTDLRSPARSSVIAVSLLVSLATLGAGAIAHTQAEAMPPSGAGQDEPVHFEIRTEFEPTVIGAPLVDAVRAGAAAQDVYTLPIQALGNVQGLSVADIGSGSGRHLVGISQAVGVDGSLTATEISESSCTGLRGIATKAGLKNVRVTQGDKAHVGLDPHSIDVALLSDVYQFVTMLDGRSGQSKHGFLTSLHEALKPDGEVIVTYVTSSELKRDDSRKALHDRTLTDFTAYGFEPGRRWVLAGPHWPVLVMEFRSPKKGFDSAREYLGRRIARTMHWEGAGWLTREERDREENSTRMLEALQVQRGWTVADYGCGNGYHTLQIAEKCGSEGKVYGVDIQPEMLTMLDKRAVEAGLKNVVSILSSELSAPLPTASCDLILLADVYHELSHPVPTLAVIRRSLKPTGRVCLLEFRAEDPTVPIKPEHKMARKQIIKELEANGFVLDSEMSELPRQHLLFFRIAE